MGRGKRKRVELDPEDEKRLARALDAYAKRAGDLVAWRTRALAYLLWDGAVRVKAAMHLNVEEVVAGSRLQVVHEIVQRPCEGNNYKERRFSLSERARGALLDYLKFLRAQGYLPEGKWEGPLFLSARKAGIRASRQTHMHSWRIFLEEQLWLSRTYLLDDLVYTGRLRFLNAAGGNTDLLSDHASISQQWAARYLPSSELSAREVLAKMHKK